MELSEIFGRAVNISFKSVEGSLKFLGLSSIELKNLIKSRKFLKSKRDFDIVIDFKPDLNQIIFYITPKKWSKKLTKKLNPKLTDFKSMVILLGKIKLFDKEFELRLGAFGIPSSDLVKAISKFKR